MSDHTNIIPAWLNQELNLADLLESVIHLYLPSWNCICMIRHNTACRVGSQQFLAVVLVGDRDVHKLQDRPKRPLVAV